MIQSSLTKADWTELSNEGKLANEASPYEITSGPVRFFAVRGPSNSHPEPTPPPLGLIRSGPRKQHQQLKSTSLILQTEDPWFTGHEALIVFRKRTVLYAGR